MGYLLLSSLQSYSIHKFTVGNATSSSFEKLFSVGLFLMLYLLLMLLIIVIMANVY